MRVQVLNFDGTVEEFEAVRAYLEEQPGWQVSGREQVEYEAASPPQEATERTEELVAKVLEYHGGLAGNQLKIFQYLYDHDREVPAEELRDEYDWSSAQFRGSMAGLPRREESAAGGRINSIEGRWNKDEEQMYYRMPKETRRAFKKVYGKRLGL